MFQVELRGTSDCKMPCRDHVRGLARLVGRVVDHALETVTNDVLMKYSPSFRANGSDQGEQGHGEGRELSPLLPKAYLNLSL